MAKKNMAKREVSAVAGALQMRGWTRATLVGLVPIVDASLANAAEANDKDPYPRVNGEIVIEVQNDFAFQPEDRDSELNDLFTTTEPEIRLHLFPGFRIVAHGVLQPVADPGPGDDRVFEDHGLYAEEVYAAFAFSAGEDSSIEIKGGKFTQNFGVAWDVAPGVYGTDFAEDYELAERIGIGGALTFDSEAIGETTLSASTFFKDTSVFSESVIRNRGRTRFADGGPSNTEKPNSFAVALDGAPSGVPGLSYHISVARQAQGQGDTAAENGVAAAAQYTATAGAVEISPILELVYFDGAGGTAGVHQHYVTPGASVGWNGWNVTLSHTSRLTHEASGADLHDAMVQVSAGYEFESGSTADVGYRWSNE